MEMPLQLTKSTDTCLISAQYDSRPALSAGSIGAGMYLHRDDAVTATALARAKTTESNYISRLPFQQAHMALLQTQWRKRLQ
jgi:hypothetical protein